MGEPVTSTAAAVLGAFIALAVAVSKVLDRVWVSPRQVSDNQRQAVEQQQTRHLEKMVELLTDMRSDNRLEQVQTRNLLEMMKLTQERIESKLDKHIEEENETLTAMARRLMRPCSCSGNTSGAC